MLLGVNIDHVATLRNARGGVEPDVLEAARICEQCGASSVTTHLREDRRHIKDVDVSNGVILVDYSALVDEKCNEIILNSNKFSSYENVLKLYEDKNPDIYISFCLLK